MRYIVDTTREDEFTAPTTYREMRVMRLCAELKRRAFGPTGEVPTEQKENVELRLAELDDLL